MTYYYIEDKKLVVRTGFKEKIGENLIGIREMIKQNDLFENTFEVALGDSINNKVIQMCILATTRRLVPCYKPIQDLGTMDVDPNYALDDGQMIRHSDSDDVSYAPFDGTAPSGIDLFEYAAGEGVVLLHAYLKNAGSQKYAIVILPNSKLFMLRIQYAYIDRSADSTSDVNAGVFMLSSDNMYYLSTAERTIGSEDQANRGYFAYKWRKGTQLFGYEDYAMPKAKIKALASSGEYVYIPLRSWTP